MTIEHELKCRPEYFQRIAIGQKSFEVRKNDRNFQVGDIIILKEHDPAEGFPDHGAYGVIMASIIYIETYAQQEGYVVLGIKVIPKEDLNESEIPY
jgi:ASC-1-like (ASCH) protein